MSLFEHHLRTKLVQFDDVRYPLDYYTPAINRNRAIFDAFLKYYRLERAAAFLARMDRELGDAAKAASRRMERRA